MSDLNLESLARRLEEVERRLDEREWGPTKDWRRVAGTFDGSEFSKLVDEEARKIREADRTEAGAEPGE